MQSSNAIRQQAFPAIFILQCLKLWLAFIETNAYIHSGFQRRLFYYFFILFSVTVVQSFPSFVCLLFCLFMCWTGSQIFYRHNRLCFCMYMFIVCLDIIHWCCWGFHNNNVELWTVNWTGSIYVHVAFTVSYNSPNIFERNEKKAKKRQYGKNKIGKRAELLSVAFLCTSLYIVFYEQSKAFIISTFHFIDNLISFRFNSMHMCVHFEIENRSRMKWNGILLTNTHGTYYANSSISIGHSINHQHSWKYWIFQFFFPFCSMPSLWFHCLNGTHLQFDLQNLLGLKNRFNCSSPPKAPFDIDAKTNCILSEWLHSIFASFLHLKHHPREIIHYSLSVSWNGYGFHWNAYSVQRRCFGKIMIHNRIKYTIE